MSLLVRLWVPRALGSSLLLGALSCSGTPSSVLDQGTSGGSPSGGASAGSSSGGGSLGVGSSGAGGAELGGGAGGALGAAAASGSGASSGGAAPPDGGGPSGGGSLGGAASGGAAFGGAGGEGGETLGALGISNLSVEVNPQMPLGVFVRWTTDEPADSEVRFGREASTHVTRTEELSTEHEMFVVGMRAETAYQIVAVSTNASATGSASAEVTTGAQPTILPARATLITPASSEAQPGYTLTNYWDGGQSPTLAVIMDEEGYPVWFYENGPERDQFGATSTQWTEEGTVVVGNAGSVPAREVDIEGNVLWVGPTGGAAPLSHETFKTPSGTYLVVRESAQSALVEELNGAGEPVWSFDLYQDSPVTNDGVNDWCHLNTAYTDPSETFVYLNCRFQGLFKVHKGTKEIAWQLGAAMDSPDTGDVTYLPDDSARFNDAHDPEVHTDGSVLLYDNQGWANRMVGEGNGNYRSRVIEYQLDETAKEASVVWEFPGDFVVDTWYRDNWSTPIWGDADRLENGNVLVTAGVTGTDTGGMTPAGTNTRIFEVTRTGEVVWAIEWPEGKGSYRAERVSLPTQKLP